MNTNLKPGTVLRDGKDARVVVWSLSAHDALDAISKNGGVAATPLPKPKDEKRP